MKRRIASFELFTVIAAIAAFGWLVSAASPPREAGESRIPIEVSAAGVERYDKEVEVEIETDARPLRLVEANSAGRIIDRNVAFQVDPSETSGKQTLTFLLQGTTPAQATRRFFLYTGAGEPDSVPAQIHIEEIAEYEGDAAFKITTPQAAYYYHKGGSGFASLIDRQGNDWISFHPQGGFRGHYRGVPNIAPPGFHPGEPNGKKPSRILRSGPIRLSILSETEDGKWGVIWDIFPTYASMTLFKKGPEPYWILYEGTPGGAFDMESDYWVDSAGTRRSVAPYSLDERWQEKLPNPQWVYFGDTKMQRVFYMSLHEPDDEWDEFWHRGDGGMTVFGFGRGPRGQWQYLQNVPAHLTIGLVEDDRHVPVRRAIESASKEVTVTVGEPEPLPAGGESAFTVGFQPRSIDPDGGHTLVADTNGDGRNDIVVHHDQHLAWLEYPSFQRHVIAQGEFYGDRFAVADLDGDGDLDIASGRKPSADKWEVYWYENPGPSGDPKQASQWKAHRVGEQGEYIKDLLAGDINRDGRLDLVARSHERTILYFQKQGEWSTRELHHPKKEGLALGDLDRDGDLDLVLNGFWLETPGDAENGIYQLHVIDKKWFDQHTGSWQDGNAMVALADLNNDGLLDVLLSHSEQVGYPIAWYSAASVSDVKAGKWTERHVTPRFDWCQTLEAGDFDNDGDLDILAAKFSREPNTTTPNEPPYPVSIFYNVRGDGSQWSREDLSDQGLYAAAVGDVGSDGKLDIVGPRSYWTGPVELLESQGATLPLDKWTYIQVDDSRPRYGGKTSGGGGWFGLAGGDITGNGMLDIASGQWFYRNPGGDMTGPWQRIPFGDLVDAVLITNVDDDEFADVIALKCNEQFWFEAKDLGGNAWRKTKIGSLPVCNHNTGAQGYTLAQLVPGGKPEIVLTGDGLFYLQIPDNPEQGNWPFVAITDSGMNGEGVAAGDIDGDGDLDLAAGAIIDPANPNSEGRVVTWWENPGSLRAPWVRHNVGETNFWGDRFALADINGDRRLDIIVSEERYPGPDPDASLFWFEAPADPKRGAWRRHTIVTEYSLNNLDVADLDRDGDIDIVTCEHKGPKERLQIWENDGRGNFTVREIDAGKESHLGARLADFDGDGDLDIFSIAWEDFQYLHLWRNDAR